MDIDFRRLLLGVSLLLGGVILALFFSGASPQWAVAISTVVLAIITLMYVWLTHNMVQELKRQTDFMNTPRLSVSYSFDENLDRPWIQFKNAGQAAAEFTIRLSLVSAGDAPRPFLKPDVGYDDLPESVKSVQGDYVMEDWRERSFFLEPGDVHPFDFSLIEEEIEARETETDDDAVFYYLRIEGVKKSHLSGSETQIRPRLFEVALDSRHPLKNLSFSQQRKRRFNL